MSSSSSSKDKHKSKKSRKDPLYDVKETGLKTGSGVNYNIVADRHVDTVRHEREREQKLMLQEKGIMALREDPVKPTSVTFDAFLRMGAGLEGKTLADKLADPNRPTWEEYKKDNADKLDLVGAEVRQMVEYRKELDKERDRKLNALGGGTGKKTAAIESDSENSSSDSGSDNKKKKKKKDKKSKKEKKEKKKKHKKDKKRKREKETNDEPVRLSDFLRQGSSEDGSSDSEDSS